MSRFSVYETLRTCFSACNLSAIKQLKQEQVREKMERECVLNQFKLDELEKQIAQQESAKKNCIKAKNLKGAQTCVRERIKLEKKREKIKQTHDFCKTLLEEINDAESIKETVSVLSDAQQAFTSLNAPKLYQKMDKITNQYSEFKDALETTNSMLASENFAGPANADLGDADLEAEFAAIESEIMASINDPKQSENVEILPSAPKNFTSPASTGTVYSSYKRAGIVQ